MTKANPPPSGCIIDLLLDVDGDNWARWALLGRPGLLMYVIYQAKDCQDCTNKLNRLFPDGLPEFDEIAGYTSEELREHLRRLRDETDTSS